MGGGESGGRLDGLSKTLTLNRTLDEPKKTVALFEFISHEDPSRAEEYWSIAKDPILEQKRYDLARKYIKDVEAEFVDLKEKYDHNVTLYDNPQIGGARFKTYTENNFVAEVQKLVELALALSNRDAATRVRDSALAVIDDKRLKNLIPEQRAQDESLKP